MTGKPPLPHRARTAKVLDDPSAVLACAKAAYDAVRHYGAHRGDAPPLLPWDFAHVIDRDLAIELVRHVLSGAANVNAVRYDFLKLRGYSFGTVFSLERRHSPLMRTGPLDMETARRDTIFVEVARAMSHALP